MPDVQGRLSDKLGHDDELDATDPPGTYAPVWRDDEIIGLNFVCPCGCKGIGGVTFRPGGWTWNGNVDAPTVQPSIFFERDRPGQWHGYLTAGVFKSC